MMLFFKAGLAVVLLILGLDATLTLVAYLVFEELWLLKLGLIKAIAFGLGVVALATIEILEIKLGGKRDE